MVIRHDFLNQNSKIAKLFVQTGIVKLEITKTISISS